MIRSGLKKFSVARKPIALKRLPQVENPEFPQDVKTTGGSQYSSLYGREDDDDPLISSKPSISAIRNSSDRLPPKEFRATDRSRLRQWAVQFALFLLMFMTIFIPLYITRKVVYPRSQNAGNLPFFDCTYSGDFSFTGIDVPFGKMPFGVAKSYDLIFNALVGRGFQTILAWVCYRLFSVILMHITESHRISYNFYAALALAPAQLSSLKPTVKSLFTKLPGFVKFQIFWLIVTTIYLALFPSLIDSISGYQAIQNTMFKLPNGTMLNTPLDDLLSASFTESWNVAFNQIIAKYVPSGADNNITFTYSTAGFAGFNDINMGYPSTSPAVFGLSTNYTYNPFNTTTTSNVALNESGVYITTCINKTTSSVFEIRYFNSSTSLDYGQLPSNDIYGPTVWQYPDDTCNNWFLLQNGFYANDQIIYSPNANLTTLEERERGSENPYTPAWNSSYFYDSNNYECVSGSKLKYQWGFSYEFLLIGSCINALWIVVTYIIFMHASFRSQMTTKGRKFGTWRAVKDLAGALHEDLGTETSAYGEDELLQQINRLGKEGRGVKYSVVGGENYDDGDQGTWKNPPRLALSSSGSDTRVRLLSGAVYG